MSGWVTVTGPPAAIWALKRGTTLPALPSTLPNRTAAKRVGERRGLGADDHLARGACWRP